MALFWEHVFWTPLLRHLSGKWVYQPWKWYTMIAADLAVYIFTYKCSLITSTLKMEAHLGRCQLGNLPIVHTSGCMYAWLEKCITSKAVILKLCIMAHERAAANSEDTAWCPWRPLLLNSCGCNYLGLCKITHNSHEISCNPQPQHLGEVEAATKELCDHSRFVDHWARSLGGT